MYVMGSVSPASEREGYSLQEDGMTMPAFLPQPPSGFSDIGDNQAGLSPAPPPPPPPLLPPPPPPPPIPPPLLPGLGDPLGGLRKKKRVRSFFWKTIPEDQVKGRANLWTQGRVPQQYQIDVQTIEELFGQNDCQTNAKSTPTRDGPTRGSFREAKEEVSILEPKRGMNIGIFLKQFKRANQVIVDDIRHGNSEPYGAEPLRELLKLLPENEEVRKLRSYRGNVSKLSLADSFIYLLIQLPSYVLRIESMLLKEEFPAVSEAMKRDISILCTAARELMLCEELHTVLHLVLQAGNILNSGGYAGNAVGFKLSSLLSLADTKANKPGMNLLHFVALEAQKRDSKLLAFPLSLSHVEAAARISLETLDADLQWMTSRTRSVEENVQKDAELLQQLDNFLQSAASSLSSLHRSRQQLRKEACELIDFFCEDHEMFRLDDCFSIFHTFCSRFTAAVKENMEREAKEAARWRRIQELEEQKRHSWAGGEKVGGTFRLRCSSETDMSATVLQQDDAGLLVDLLTLKSGPRSPLIRRSGSFRRSRNSPSTLPSIAAERELSAFLGMTTQDCKIAQQQEVVPLASTQLPETRPPSLRAPGTNVFLSQQPQRGAMALRTHPSHPQTSLSAQDANHATSAYLSNDASQAQCNTISPTNIDKPTSDTSQQSDHNNNSGKDLLDLHGRPVDQPAEFGLMEGLAKMKKCDEDISGEISKEKLEHSAATPGSMSVVLEKCSLVPKLKAFDVVTSESPYTSRRHGQEQDDLVVRNVEEEGQNGHKKEGCDAQMLPSQREEEEEGQKEKVIVWCVTGVCEIAADLTHSENIDAQTTNDQPGSDNQRSSSPSNRTPPETPANENVVPVPISSQPVPVTHFDDPSHPVSSPRCCSAEPASADKGPTSTICASEEVKEDANQEEHAGGSTNEIGEALTVTEQSMTASCCTANQNTKVAPFSNRRAASFASSKTIKDPPTSKTQQTGMKPANPNSAPGASKSRSVRTLTNSENQGMRRVVPISRSSRGALPQGKHLEKPPGSHQGSSTTATPSGLNVSSTSHRRGERPSTAPSSRRSSFNKIPDTKDLKDPKVLSTRLQNQDLQKKPCIRKPLIKPKPQPEEKMCRSTLRALAQGGGGGGSISAPTTPKHKASASSSLPGFARSTASSSLRRAQMTLAPSKAGSDSSSEPFPKTTSSIAPPSGSSPLTRTGSLRVSRSSDPHNPSSPSPLSRSQSIRAPPHSPRQDSLIPPKGHRRNDSGTFSDKSAHSRDSAKSIKPSWR